MTNIDIIFSRNLLKEVLKTVSKHTTVNQRKSIWTYHFGRDNYEVQSTGKDRVNPNYWSGRASNAYEARANFWMQWLDRKGISQNEKMKIFVMKDAFRGTVYSWTKAKSYEEAEKKLGNEWFSSIEEADGIKNLPKHLEVKKKKHKK